MIMKEDKQYEVFFDKRMTTTVIVEAKSPEDAAKQVPYILRGKHDARWDKSVNIKVKPVGGEYA